MRRIFALLLLVGCGGSGTFAMSADDNNPIALSHAFSLERKPTVGKPMNDTGKPMAFMVASGLPKRLIAWDLSASKTAWAVNADVTSRVAVGQSLVASREGKSEIVARGVRDGHKLWEHPLDKTQTFLGLAADGNRVFYTAQDDTGKRKWVLVALENGREVWRAEAPGTLGAPAARGGLVYMPFMTQWLTILDAATGAQVARIRQEDEALNFVRTTADGVYYGSKGVFLLDDKSVAGTKKGATYASANLPDFVRTFYYFDAFKSVQAEYSAFDRNRVLWRALAEGGGLQFQDGLATVFTYRFFFGFDAATGDLKWAYHHPRFDVVSAEHVGPSIVYVSQEGELGAIDPVSGAGFGVSKVGARILGATFDADGYRPEGDGQPVSTSDVLAQMVADKDSRFNSQKIFAITALGSLPGAQVVETLLKLLRDEGTAPALYQKAGEALVSRKNPEALPRLIEALKVQNDYLSGSKTAGTDVIARALGALGSVDAVPALLAQIDAPETPRPYLKDLASALAACQGKAALPTLRTQLVMYRADPQFATDAAALGATIDALLALGGPAERELLAYVAAEPRTAPKVAEYARRVLEAKVPAPAVPTVGK